MKKLLFTLAILAASAASTMAQVPQAFAFQSNITDTLGAPYANESISVKFEVISGSSNGTVEYSETHQLQTNAGGYFVANVGDGAVQSGTFTAIDWPNNSYWLGVGVDTTGGTNYENLGASKLLAVPYAIHSKSSDSSTVSNVSHIADSAGLANMSATARSVLDLKTPFGSAVDVALVAGGSTYNVPAGKVARVANVNYNTWVTGSYTNSFNDEIIELYDDNPDLTFVSHDITASDYTVPAGYVFKLGGSPTCDDGFTGTIYTRLGTIYVNLNGMLIPENATITFDFGACASPAYPDTQLRGILIPKQ